MRTLDADLVTATGLATRQPVSRATLRNMRLRFAAYTTGTNPWSITNDAAQVASEDYAYGDSIALATGTILRAWGQNGNMRLQRIASPQTASQWSHATNPYQDLGFAATAYTNPTLVADGTTIYLFYARLSTLRYRTSTDDGATWSGETDTFQGLVGTPTLAAVSKDEIYACTAVSGLIAVVRFANSGGWSNSSMPWFVLGNSTHAIVAPEYDSVTFFDAYSLAGQSWFLYSFGNAGKTWVSGFRNGVWNDPKLIVPDDYSRFVATRAAVIDGKVWVTGRMERENAALYSPAWDTYVYSSDGETFTGLSRDAWLGSAELRGKLLFSSAGGTAYVYYAGIYTVLRAPATYLIVPATDPSGQKMTLGLVGDGNTYDDLMSVKLDYSSAGSSPTVTLNLKSGDDTYFSAPKSDIARLGSEVWFEGGYNTSVGKRFATLLQASIDQMPGTRANGYRENSIVARCSASKRIRDWNSLFYWDLLSQHKHLDPCNIMDHLVIMDGGDFRTTSDNLIANDDFETNDAGWTSYATGTGAGTAVRTDEESQAGAYSLRLIKTAGADADQYGRAITFPVLAGQSYRASLYAHVTAIAGGLERVKLLATGPWGTAGATETVEVSLTGETTVWEQLSVSLTAVVSATATLRILLDNCTTGTLYFDTIEVVQTSLGFIRFVSQDQISLLFSTTPLDAADFDVRVRLADVAVAAPANKVEMGLIGLASDKFNYICFLIERGNNTLTLYKVRNGNRTLLASSSDPLGVGGNLAANVAYDLRLVHRGGRFLGYFKLASAADWGTPFIDYAWAQTDAPCLSASGRGKLGTLSHIRPFKFRAMGLDQYSTVVCLKANEFDWASFPSSGEIFWEGERITFATKTGSSTVYPVSQCYGADRLFINYQTMETEHWRPEAWGHRLDLAVGSPTLNYLNFAVNAGAGGGEPYAAWKILESFDIAGDAAPNPPFVPGPGGNMRVRCDPSGHSNTNGIINGLPHWHGMGMLLGARGAGIRITPALLGCVRGANGTTAIRHTDGSTPYQFADDEVQIQHFMYFDFASDFSTEDLLRRCCIMAGVLAPEFKDAAADASEVMTPAGSYATPTWLAFDGKDFDLRFTFDATQWGTATTLSASIVFRANSQNWATTIDALVLDITWASTIGRVDLSYRSLVAGVGATTLQERFLLDKPPLDGPVVGRLVVTGEFVTLYLNGAVAASFHTTLLPSNGANSVGLSALGHAITFTNVRIPELYDWREAIFIDNDASGQAALQKVIDDRPISYISRSGATLLFSVFDTRNDLGTFTNQIIVDTVVPSDMDVFTFVRVYADEILEQADTTLLAEHGFLLRTFRMPRSSNALAGAMITRLFRRVNEGLEARSVQLWANFAFEIEDKFALSYTATGTGLVVARSLIVNDMSYVFEPANVAMMVNARRWIS